MLSHAKLNYSSFMRWTFFSFIPLYYHFEPSVNPESFRYRVTLILITIACGALCVNQLITLLDNHGDWLLEDKEFQDDPIEQIINKMIMFLLTLLSLILFNIALWALDATFFYSISCYIIIMGTTYALVKYERLQDYLEESESTEKLEVSDTDDATEADSVRVILIDNKPVHESEDEHYDTTGSNSLDDQ